jgi:hypothetical protein
MTRIVLESDGVVPEEDDVLHEHLEFALTNILVVQLHALAPVLEGIKASVTALGRHIKRVAALRFEVENAVVSVVKSHKPAQT